MTVADIARKLLPPDAAAYIARTRKRFRRARIERLPRLSEKDFTAILTGDLGLALNDTVYIGSSVDQLHLDFPFYRILDLVREVIGAKGNILLPTYPNRAPMSSYQYLQEGRVFDVRRSPSYTGLLSEFARRRAGAVRSLHPTKSVCVIGPDAVELTREHQNSPYPYDVGSPYYKLIEHEAKVIGLGIWTEYLSFGYTVDDAMKENPPVRTYYPEIFAAKCIDYEGREVTVETYAHNMNNVVHDVPRFMREHIAPEICQDLTIKGMRFFRADAKKLFDEMLWLARQGITTYPGRVYSKEFLATLAKRVSS
jgi:aminoglycoside 3-N-acetyltransferase